MKCAFEDKNGFCHGRYSGFKCIKEKCSDFEKYLLPDEICAYYRDGYCKILRTFDCDGKKRFCKHYKTHLDEEDLILIK